MKDIKNVVFLLMFSVAFTMTGQTKLINHKSHSGTHQTFNPHSSEGNFGVAPVSFKEIHKDSTSKYKLLYSKKNSLNKIVYTLFKQTKISTETPSNVNNDTLILEVELSGNDSREFAKLMKKMMIRKLKAYRKNEK